MPENTSHGYPPNHLPLAKRLRREMTPAEAILWRHVRAKRFSGFKFRRQQPIGPFIADFMCMAARVIVELDGDTHVGKEAEDASRQAALEGLGYRVLRFWNGDVSDDLEMVLDTVWLACDAGVKARAGGSEG